MSALTNHRNTRELYCGALKYTWSAEAAGTVYAGGLVALNADSKAVAASDTSNLIVLGVAQNDAVSGGSVLIETGVFLFDNGTSTEALSRQDIGKTCFIVDDQTVGKTGGTNHIKAGTVLDVTDSGVAVLLPGDKNAYAAADHTHSAE